MTKHRKRKRPPIVNTPCPPALPDTPPRRRGECATCHADICLPVVPPVAWYLCNECFLRGLQTP